MADRNVFYGRFRWEYRRDSRELTRKEEIKCR